MSSSRLCILLFATTLTTTVATAQGSTGAIAPALSANSNSLYGRSDAFGRPAPDARGWTDPALSHNRLLQDQGTYVVVGQYKVLGSPFLFGQNHNADLFAPTERAYNINISYNAHNQDIEFYSTSNPGSPLTKSPGEVDSFTLKQDINAGIMHDLKFVYGKLVGGSDKAYFQVIESGNRFSLYKGYKGDLEYPSGNYSSADVREFNLVSEYFYVDSNHKKMKKLKPSLANVIKEFKSIKDVSGVTTNEEYAANPELAIRKMITALNK